MKRICVFMVAFMILCSFFASCGTNEKNHTSENLSNTESNGTAWTDDSQPRNDLSDITQTSETTDVTDPSLDDVSAESSEDDSSSYDQSTETSVPDIPDEPQPPTESREKAFRLSSIDDVSDNDGIRTYTVYAPYSDKYVLECEGVSGVTISQNGQELKSGKDNLTVSLKKDQLYTLTVMTEKGNEDFLITTTAQNHVVTLPYDVADPLDVSNIDVNGSEENPLVAAEVNYIKRAGGTYVYSNNPEMFTINHVGKAFMRNHGLTGEVYVTFEHANYSGKPVYLGYQLKNESDHDVYVTVTNVGYQWVGTWFGQLAWYDFYNTSFELPDDYFTSTGAISSKYSGLDYAYRKYQPRIYQPTTYRLPAGEYFWVIGGTSADAYRNINVDNSANHTVGAIKCANGNVKFCVTGGKVTGTMYCYNDILQVQAEPKAMGYVAGDYSQQYSGIADHHGIIDNYMMWTFNDNIGSGMLPVTYTNYYDDSIPSYTSPYGAYNSTPHTVNTNTWMTHLNPQNDHRAVGMDMVEFKWHTMLGKDVIFDNNHADGSGKPANTGNWMIEYQDHFTFVNQGDSERTVTLHLRDHGSLAILVRDSVSGDVIETAFTAGLGENNVFSNYTYDVVIPAHSIKQITLDYLMVACSYGSVIHAATIQ